MPTFSLMHPTKRLPDGWLRAWEAWCEYADSPSDSEYLISIDPEDFDLRPAYGSLYIDYPHRISTSTVFNSGRPCTVDAWNTAAKLATGKVFICAADDLFPCPHWDTLILEAIGDLEKEAVLWVDVQDNNPEIMTHPILTKAYYGRPGRGGMPNGELFYPEYISVGNDDDFTQYAWKDGVVIDARKTIHFDHRQCGSGKAPSDAVYEWSNRKEAWDRKHEVLPRRQACGFTK